MDLIIELSNIFDIVFLKMDEVFDFFSKNKNRIELSKIFPDNKFVYSVLEIIEMNNIKSYKTNFKSHERLGDILDVINDPFYWGSTGEYKFNFDYYHKVLEHISFKGRFNLKIENDMLLFDLIKKVIFFESINIEKLNNTLKRRNLRVVLENRMYVVKFIYKEKFLVNCVEQKYHLNYRNLKQQFYKKYTSHLFMNIGRKNFENFFYINILSKKIKAGDSFLNLYFSEFNIIPKSKNKKNEYQLKSSYAVLKPSSRDNLNRNKNVKYGVYETTKLREDLERKRLLRQKKINDEKRLLDIDYDGATKKEKMELERFIKRKTRGKRLSCGRNKSSNKLQANCEGYNLYTKTVSFDIEGEEKELVGNVKLTNNSNEVKLCYCWECMYFNLNPLGINDFYSYKQRFLSNLNVDAEVLDLIFDIWESNKDKTYYSVDPQDYKEEKEIENKVMLTKSSIVFQMHQNTKKILWKKKDNNNIAFSDSDSDLDDRDVIEEVAESESKYSN